MPTPRDLVAALDRDQPSELAPLYLLALPESGAELQRSAALCPAAWALAQPPLVAAATPREGALRIGYLSADFRNHPVAHLVTEVIAAEDPTQSEVFLYAYGPRVDDAPRGALQQRPTTSSTSAAWTTSMLRGASATTASTSWSA